MQCEDELLQALALSVMPLEELKAEATAELVLNESLGQGNSMTLAVEDLLAKKLLHWFKFKFFRLVLDIVFAGGILKHFCPSFILH
jgi:hypothetical protein